MIPLDFDVMASILGLAIGALGSAWLLGLLIANLLAKMTLPTGKRISLQPFVWFGVATLATVACFFAGRFTAHLCVELVGYPPFRIEPAAFTGGPPDWLIMMGVCVGWFTQVCVAVAIWFLALRVTAKPIHEAS